MSATESSPSETPAPEKPVEAVPVVVAPAKPRPWKLIIAAVIVVIALIALTPMFLKSLHTVSTDDAYVNGHVTFVAPRVAGQVARVLVDDNNRVHKGDLLLQLDPEPLQVQVNIATSAVEAAQADLIAAVAQVRGMQGQTRSLRFGMERTMEEVDNQIALLRSKVATVASQQATLNKAQADYDRALPLVSSGAVTKEDLDLRKENLLVSKAKLEEAMQGVYQVRVSLGLPDKPEPGDDLTQVPPNLDQTFSSVLQAQASLIQAASQLGYFDDFDKSPKEMIADFYKQDPQGDINRIYAKIAKSAPLVKQAQTKLMEAQSNLQQAELNLRYCNVVAEIDGVVTRRNVNPGNNVVAGQSLMAVRSLSEVWVDANFKETQLADLRIGQPVDLDVDTYGSSHHFKGRISGFTMGTGSTLALLPAENATGNFVKVVQRLPVRIDLVDYDPDKLPLFIGLSVTPTVDINQTPGGPDAGKILQPHLAALELANQPTTLPTSQP